MTILSFLFALALIGLGVWIALRPRKNDGSHNATFGNIAEGTHDAAVTRKTDAAITTRYLLYKVGSDAAHIAVGGASDIPIGTIEDEKSAAELTVAVNLLGKGGTKIMVASEAIDAGERVFAAGSGKVQDLPGSTGTYYQVGIALTAASADGDKIEVLDCVPIAVAVA